MNVEVYEEPVVQRLRRENPEFLRWEEEHKKLEQTLAGIDTHPYLSPEEEVERKRIQKLKLAAKDRMMDLVRRQKMAAA